MKDLVQCTVSRNDFQRWLDWGNAPLTICTGEKAVTMLLKIEKSRLTICTRLPWKHKDATDLVLQNTGDERPLLIRRLTPLECERLQGFPDFWTDLPGASDSSRYKALGNSVAIPCVEYIMRGIAMAVTPVK